MTSSGLPRVLQARATKLMSDLDVGVQRVPWNTAGNRTGGETISFTLPQGIIDLHSLNVLFEFSVATGETYKIPVADALIGGLAIDVAGTSASAIPRYGYIASHLRRLTTSTADQAAMPQTFNVDVGTEGSAVVPGFMAGFLSGSHQRYLDTSLFKHLTIEITLPPKLTSVGKLSAVNPNPSVAISNCTLQYTTIRFSDNAYRNMLKSMGSVRIPFNAWYTSLSAEHQTSINASVLRASQSMDAVYVFRPPTAYQTTAMSSATAGAFYTSVSLDDTSFNVELNGHNYYSSDLVEGRGHVRIQTANALATRGMKVRAPFTTADWRAKGWLGAVAMSLPGGHGVVSGVNTYESTSPLTVKYSSPSSVVNHVLVVAVECTSSVAIELASGEISFRQ